MGFWLSTLSEPTASMSPISISFIYSLLLQDYKGIMCHDRKHFKLWVHWPKRYKYFRVQGDCISCRHQLTFLLNQDGSVLLVYKIEFTFLPSESTNPDWGGLLLIFDGLVCESVYISHLTFFRLGTDSRRRWKCRVGATDRHAIALWPLSFTSRQADRKGKNWALTNMDKHFFRLCNLSARGNAVWMADISLLYASINHRLSLLSSVLLFLCFLLSKCIKINWEKMLLNRYLKEAEQ